MNKQGLISYRPSQDILDEIIRLMNVEKRNSQNTVDLLVRIGLKELKKNNESLASLV